MVGSLKKEAAIIVLLMKVMISGFTRRG